MGLKGIAAGYMFQFHTVQLKQLLPIPALHNIVFQFHTVQLKQLSDKEKEIINSRFNSIRYN